MQEKSAHAGSRPGASRKPWKRAILGVLIVILVALAGAGVWLSLPTERVPVARILPSSPFAYFTVKLDRDDPAVKGIVERPQGKAGRQERLIQAAGAQYPPPRRAPALGIRRRGVRLP